MPEERHEDLWAQADVPDWMHILHVPAYLERTFHFVPSETIPVLLRALKSDSFDYRVAGLEPVSSPTRRALPPGFSNDKRVYALSMHSTWVCDWDIVGFDPQTGTVNGRHRNRHNIEVRRLSLDRWAEHNRFTLDASFSSRHRRKRDQLVAAATPASGNAQLQPLAISTAGEQKTVGPLKRRHAGRDYTKADEPLVQEAIDGMDNGRFENASDAADQLAEKARGYGVFQSKKTRLLTRITKRRRDLDRLRTETNEAD